MKKAQGPGLTWEGGVAEPGHHGIPWLTILARAEVAEISNAAVEPKKERLDMRDGWGMLTINLRFAFKSGTIRGNGRN